MQFYIFIIDINYVFLDYALLYLENPWLFQKLDIRLFYLIVHCC